MDGIGVTGNQKTYSERDKNDSRTKNRIRDLGFNAVIMNVFISFQTVAGKQESSGQNEDGGGHGTGDLPLNIPLREEDQ